MEWNSFEHVQEEFEKTSPVKKQLTKAAIERAVKALELREEKKPTQN